ncbi:MAG: type II toxin-antitoxin system RelE/ParE family toxin [Chloroflexota bacterium]|nr:type II toxin-antitoxin system RelE/ParE family toxin [Chloroflexota bacterium]
MLLSKKAQEDLEGIRRGAPKTATRILHKLDMLEKNPRRRMPGVKRLKTADTYRLRVGDYRVLFTITGEVIIIQRIVHRKDAYQVWREA